jgi:hypothetical protein
MKIGAVDEDHSNMERIIQLNDEANAGEETNIN